MTWSERLGRVGVWRGVNDLDPAPEQTVVPALRAARQFQHPRTQRRSYDRSRAGLRVMPTRPDRIQHWGV